MKRKSETSGSVAGTTPSRLSGTAHVSAGYQMNRISWELVFATFKIKNQFLEFAMPSRKESTFARERLQLETPICDDASLLKLEEEVAEYLREAKRRDALRPDELVSPVVDAVARGYFLHVLRKQARVMTLRRRIRPVGRS
jgi:hypothetical protein